MQNQDDPAAAAAHAGAQLSSGTGGGSSPVSAVDPAPAGPPPPESRGALKLWQAGVMTLVLLALSFAPVFLYGLVVAAVQVVAGHKAPQSLLVAVTAGTGFLAYWCALLIARRWFGRSLREMAALMRVSPWVLPPLVLTVIGLAIVLSEVDNLFRFVFPAPQILVTVMKQMTQAGWASAILVVVQAPICEELFFRGFMLGGLLRRYGPVTAVLASSAIFSLFHINPYQMIGAFVIGCLLGWLYVVTRSIWPCIFGHALNNLAAFLAGAGVLPRLPGFSGSGATHTFQPLWLDLLGLGLLAVGGVLLALLARAIFRRRREGTAEGASAPGAESHPVGGRSGPAAA